MGKLAVKYSKALPEGTLRRSLKNGAEKEELTEPSNKIHYPLEKQETKILKHLTLTQ